MVALETPTITTMGGGSGEMPTPSVAVFSLSRRDKGDVGAVF